MAAGKRKRGAGFSERDKFEHKSATLLQRESKKVKAFLARKAVQQLKQQQQQAASSSGDANSAKAKKQRAQIQKRERELAALKVDIFFASTWRTAMLIDALAVVGLRDWSRRWT